MSQDTLRHEPFLLVGYLLAGAHGLYEEPAGYGPFRLLDGVGPSVGYGPGARAADPFLGQLEESIRVELFGDN